MPLRILLRERGMKNNLCDYAKASGLQADIIFLQAYAYRA